jgi:serine/threonine protein phosphatase PrpC
MCSYVMHAVVGDRRPPFLAGSREAGALAFAYATRIGARHRERGGVNEDSIAIEQDAARLHAVVADGVSMGAFGAVASATCANHLAALRPRYPLEGGAAEKAALQAGILAADGVVAGAVARLGAGEGATTFSSLWFSCAGNGWVSRCGDCRVWLFWRDGQGGFNLHQLGEDQTFENTGETLYADYVPSNNPSRMVGLGENYVGTPAVWDVTLAGGTGVLLTSDGVHGVLSAGELRYLMAAGFAHGMSLGRIVRSIRDRVRDCGGRDDLSVFLLYRKADSNLQRNTFSEAGS